GAQALEPSNQDLQVMLAPEGTEHWDAQPVLQRSGHGQSDLVTVGLEVLALDEAGHAGKCPRRGDESAGHVWLDRFQAQRRRRVEAADLGDEIARHDHGERVSVRGQLAEAARGHEVAHVQAVTEDGEDSTPGARIAHRLSRGPTPAPQNPMRANRGRSRPQVSLLTSGASADSGKAARRITE